MLKTALKFLFAGGIIYWLIQSGKLDFTLLSQSFENGYFWWAAFGLLLLQAFWASFRWKILLETKSKKALPAKKIISLNWIGLFFNTVLPGAVTGDLIKLLYAKDLSKDLSKTFLITSTLIDRVLGLAGLLILLSFFSLWNYNEMVILSPKMENLIHFNLLLGVGASSFLISLFAPRKLQAVFLDTAIQVPVLGKKVHKTLEQVWIMGRDKKAITKCLLMSVTLQFLGVFAFWVVTHEFYGREIPLGHVFTFIPIGMMAIAIPISPAGLGVGHVIYDTLFKFVGVEGGASLFNLFFICLVSVNLLGIIPYLLSGKKHSLEEAENFNEQGAD